MVTMAILHPNDGTVLWYSKNAKQNGNIIFIAIGQVY